MTVGCVFHMHNMFQSGTEFWGGTWIRRTTPFREAWVLTPLMPFPCVHGLTGYGPSAFTAGFTRATGRSSWDDVH
jgi:hypothetical protein